MRGGGGNFGVVTSLEFRLHPVHTIYGGPIFFELDTAADVMAAYDAYIETAPEEGGTNNTAGGSFSGALVPFLSPER